MLYTGHYYTTGLIIAFYLSFSHSNISSLCVFTVYVMISVDSVMDSVLNSILDQKFSKTKIFFLRGIFFSTISPSNMTF